MSETLGLLTAIITHHHTSEIAEEGLGLGLRLGFGLGLGLGLGLVLG